MSTSGKPIPTKLKHDAIIEAIFEMRFDTGTKVPEVFFGRIIEYAAWKGFDQRQMPAHEIPSLLRERDQNLRYLPIFELVDATNHRTVRIGAQVLSFHQMVPYVGWERFKPRLVESVDELFDMADAPVVRRLGLRYINALRPDPHGIGAMSDLDLCLTVANQVVYEHMNVNFTRELTEDMLVTIRVATADLIQGSLPMDTSVLVDVDMSTKNSFSASDRSQVTKWIDSAHSNEKEQFFRLLTDKSIDRLREA